MYNLEEVKNLEFFVIAANAHVFNQAVHAKRLEGWYPFDQRQVTSNCEGRLIHSQMWCKPIKATATRLSQVIALIQNHDQDRWLTDEEEETLAEKIDKLYIS